jgi:hypothetical protein
MALEFYLKFQMCYAISCVHKVDRVISKQLSLKKRSYKTKCCEMELPISLVCHGWTINLV